MGEKILHVLLILDMTVHPSFDIYPSLLITDHSWPCDGQCPLSHSKSYSNVTRLLTSGYLHY